MLWGLVSIIFMFFLIQIGISSGDYSLTYFGIFFLTISFWGGFKASLNNDSPYNNTGCLPDALFILFQMSWVILGADYELAEYFEIFMTLYFAVLIAYIIYIVTAATNPKTNKQTKKTSTESKYHNINCTSVHSKKQIATVKKVINGTPDEHLKIKFTSEDKQRAIEILNSQLWEKLSLLDKGRIQHVCRKEFAANQTDFEWVVGYLSEIGTPENPKSPYSYMISNIDGIEYKSIKVNKYFEGTVIYRYEEPIGSHEDTAALPPMLKLRSSKTKYLVEERFKKDPVAQYNLQLLIEKKAELKEKKEEYLKMRNWDNDDILISLSTSSTLDIEEYKEKIEDLKDEIEDLKDEIEEIRYELDEIRDSIEEEIEDEEWEREMEIF